MPLNKNTKDLINLKKIPLDDVRDESDENIRIVLKPKNRNIDKNKLVDLCFKLSDLSIKYSCNFNALEKGWSIKKKGERFVFSKNHEGKKEVFLDSYLKRFIHTNLKKY